MSTRKFTGYIGNHIDRVTFTLELDARGTFSLTFDEYERGRLVSCGAGGVELEKHLSADDRAIVQAARKWHLVNANTGPMRYIPNALYWAGCSGWRDGKPNSPPNWDYFLSTIVWGAVETDNDFELQMYFDNRNAGKLRELLARRFESLMDAFDTAMNGIFGAGTITR